MDINIPQPPSHEFMIFNKLNDFMIFSTGCHGKILKQREYFSSLAHVSACEFTNNKRVTDYMPITQ